MHFPGAPGPPEAPGQPPGRSAAPRGCGGGEARRAPGPRPAPGSEAPCARNRTPASRRPGSATSRWVFRGPRRTPPGRPLPDAPRSSPAAGQGASAAAAGDAAGAASAAAGRAPRPRQGQPLPSPRPSSRQPLAATSLSAPPLLPVAGQPVTQWRNGAAYIFLPCIGVVAGAGERPPHLACTLRPERMQPLEATKAPVSPRSTTWSPWPFLLALGPIFWRSRRGDRSWL